MNSKEFFKEIARVEELLEKAGIKMTVSFIIGGNIGYGESDENYNKNIENEISIICGNDEEIYQILQEKRENVEIPDWLSLKLIESFHHEIKHIIHRFFDIKRDDHEGKVLALEYLISSDGKWANENYKKTYMDRDCELYGYYKTLMFIDNLDISQERKEELFGVMCDNFQFVYKNILKKKDLEIEGDTNKEKAVRVVSKLFERANGVLDSARGIVNKVEYKEYLGKML